MKWKMSSITPNIVKNTVIRSGFRLISGEFVFFFFSIVFHNYFLLFLVDGRIFSKFFFFNISKKMIVQRATIGSVLGLGT